MEGHSDCMLVLLRAPAEAADGEKRKGALSEAKGCFWAKGLFDRHASGSNRGTSVGDGACHSVEMVYHPLMTGILYVYSAPLKQFGIGFPLVAQRIIFRGVDVRFWQTCHVASIQR